MWRRSGDLRRPFRSGVSDLTDLVAPAPPIATTERGTRFGWKGIALALLIAFLAYQVVIPFVMIIWTSLKTARPGEPEFVSLTFTLSNYVRAFGSEAFWRTTGNTLSFALAATLLAFVMGTFIAWVV